MTERFEKLFEPGYIGKMKVNNRIVKAPTEMTYANRDGSVSERMLRYYKDVALGGSGLVLVEMTSIDDKGSEYGFATPAIYDHKFMPGMALLAQTIKKNGAKAGLQLYHGGANRHWKPIKAPSPIPWGVAFAQVGFASIPHQLSISEIEEIIEAFGDCALRGKQVGFDIIEVHGAHGYLITQFLSPLTNKRTDWYGGSLENRMRFLIQIATNVRNKVGPSFPISIRLSGSEYVEGGITIEETTKVAKALEQIGVDVLDISGGGRGSGQKLVVPMYYPEGVNVWAAEAIKEAVSIPIIVCGSINRPELAEQILEEGKADFIGMARALLADPYLPKKANEGRVEDIVPCIRCCGDGCTNTERKGFGGVLCTVNVAIGKEDESRIEAAKEPKDVAIIGGGPAGMKAAQVAALSGHRVTLFEKRELGGHLIEAGVPEFKKDIRRLVLYLINQIRKLEVRIIEKEAKAEDIIRGGFHVVIVATGSTSLKPRIPGVHKSIVVDALEVLSGVETGNNVIIVGGGAVGCDTALFIASKGKNVTVVEMRDDIAKETDDPVDMHTIPASITFWDKFTEAGVRVFTRTKLDTILDDGIVVTNKSGVKSKLAADSVVLALGFTPVAWDGLDEISDKVEVRMVGDCVEPRKIFDAIHEGYLAARNL